MDSFVDNVIELNEKDNYYVIKQLLFNNTIYVLANLLLDEETPSDEMSIMKVNVLNDKVTFTLETDANILNELTKRFAEVL